MHTSVRRPVSLLAVGFAAGLAAAAQQAPYYPPRGAWAARPASAVGMDSGGLAAAVAYALAHETPFTAR